MGNRLGQRLSERPVEKGDLLEFINRELAPIVRKVVGIFGNRLIEGSGSPENIVEASPGAIYQRTDGGAGTSMYVKESGTGSAGWVAK